MANHDHVADLYYGRTDRVETQNACRDRIHWLCSKVAGSRVLDVGCSQGISSIILAREGHEVLGLDIEAESLDAAREALAQEPAMVRQRVRFVQGDAYEVDLEAGAFDSIILGQILEHLVHPAGLIERLHGWLRPGGRLVVSVPLGFHPYHDHKRTFYLTSLLDLLSPHFSVIDVAALNARHLCCVGERPPEGSRPDQPSIEMLHEWAVRCDRALEEIQQRAHTDKLRSDAARKKVQQRYNELREEHNNAPLLSYQLEQAEKMLKQERESRERAERRARYYRNHFEETQQVLDVRMNEVRYRLGDALVRAARPSWDTLLLPVRIASLFWEGLRKVSGRRRAMRVDGVRTRSSDETAGSAGEAGRSRDGAPPKPRPLPDWLLPLEGAPELEESYSTTPPDRTVRKDLPIAGVMDEFSWRAWQHEADLYTFTPATWRTVLEAKPPRLLLIESTWHGIEDAWHFQVRDLGGRPDKIKRYALPEIVEWCRHRGIPTVFYNKEDPPNFEFFIDAAKLFDYIFTSDANCIEDYRERVGHDRIYALPFAAQPRIHNPITTAERLGNVCFAGTWYNHRHKERQAVAEAILRPALDLGLCIFDRMADSPSKNYRWPEIYQDSIYGSLSYSRMVEAYKRFKVFLNINSVSDSPTMFARRVFELLASGTPVLSSESKGIERLLGSDLVLMASNERTSRALLTRLLEDDEYRERLALQGQRKVFSEHTYSHRLETVLKTVGLDPAPVERPAITLIAAIERPGDVDSVLDHVQRQSYGRASLILCANDAESATRAREAASDGTTISAVDESGACWGELLHRAIASCSSGWVAVMRPGDCYGPHYLTDYANAMLYVDGSAIGKQRYHSAENGEPLSVVDGGRDYRFVEAVCPWTLCLPVEQARKLSAPLRGCRSVFEFWDRLMRSFGRIYSADRFNYVRRGADERAEGEAMPSASSAQAREEGQFAAALV
ncbi:MAG: methyltransferase domain-containing protein [Phycisphaerae bacterium]